MRNLFLLLALTVITNSVFAVTSKSPIPPAIAKKLAEVDKEKIIQAKLTVSGTYEPGEYALGQFLPEGALVTRTFVYIKEGPISASQNTVSFGCEATNDLVAATNVDPLATDTVIQGATTGATSDMNYISSSCEISATVDTALGGDGTGLTDGELYLYVKYLPNE